MKILFVSAEVAPFAKVGGLADVAGSLPKVLKTLGHDVRILMPAYKMVLDDERWSVHQRIARFELEIGDFDGVEAELATTSLDEVPVWLIGARGHFDKCGTSEQIYNVGVESYLFWTAAGLTACENQRWIPDIIHCNDWQSGFFPVLQREDTQFAKWQCASVFTIHNLAYQGEFGAEVLPKLDLPTSLFDAEHVESFGRVNFLKAGCSYAHQSNTVSPQYAMEVQTPEFGCRQWGLMQFLASQGRFRGILNGIDTGFFDPSSDSFIETHYSASHPLGKSQCKAALLKELELAEIKEAPLVGVVSRLSDQKGFDLILEGIHEVLDFPCQIVVLGTGDPAAAVALRKLVSQRPTRARFIERFDAPLAQRIYSGSDMFLMPSAFEPCGLGQLIALRYGTIPVVRSVGGLADTIFEGTNGFTFLDKSANSMTMALRRAFDAYSDKPRWAALVGSALSGDYGWEKSAGEYVKMYSEALAQVTTGIAQ